MKAQYTRRDFLKTAGMGAAALGILVYLKSPSVGSRQAIKCSKCGSVFADGHAHTEGAICGVYCPNCGVEISRLAHDLNDGLRVQYPRKARRSKKRVTSWDCAQVPFPNRTLVQNTVKPATVLSNIRI